MLLKFGGHAFPLAGGTGAMSSQFTIWPTRPRCSSICLAIVVVVDRPTPVFFEETFQFLLEHLLLLRRQLGFRLQVVEENGAALHAKYHPVRGRDLQVIRRSRPSTSLGFARSGPTRSPTRRRTLGHHELQPLTRRWIVGAQAPAPTQRSSRAARVLAASAEGIVSQGVERRMVAEASR